jgi:hypothetical protein
VGEARMSVSEECTFNRKHTIFASKAGRPRKNEEIYTCITHRPAASGQL